MLAGVATRRHEAVAEPVGTKLEKAARATSKSALSRRFVKVTEKALFERNARDRSSLEVAVVMIDGIELAGQCCVVCLVISADGTKVPV
jgi:putative transposase